MTAKVRGRGFVNTAIGFVVVGVASIALAACGSSSSSGGTSYWEAHYTNGTNAFMSVVISSGQVSGWESGYPPNDFAHYDGQVNSDGTMDVTAYAGSTASISGSSMTITLENDQGDMHFQKISQSAYKAAGGPG